MKISETINKLFGLSDLKGLISENAFDEAKPKFGAPSMTGFFEKHPEFIDKTYYSSPELRAALYDYFKPTDEFPSVVPFPHPNEYDTMPQDIRKKYYTRVKNGKPQHLDKVRKANVQIQFNNDTLNTPTGTQETPKTIKKSGTPLELLRFLFNKNGGESILYPVEPQGDFSIIIEYIDKICAFVDVVGEDIKTNYGLNTIVFNDNGINVGYEKDPFLFFLLFFYKSKYCQRRGVEGKLNTYIQNITDPNVAEYVKNLFNITPNIFNIVMTTQMASMDSDLTPFSADMFLPARSEAYFMRYAEKYPGLFTDDILNRIKSEFGFATKSMLFDPIGNNKITDDAIGKGIRNWCKGSPDKAIKELIKPPINDNRDQCSPIEKIFITARILDELLDKDYNRFGTGPGRTRMSIDLLLEDGRNGIEYWNRMKRGGKIPKAQIQLMTMYDAEKIKAPNEPIPFWRILNLNNEIKDKTQGEIYYFLIGNSIPDVSWTYEYNRSKKIDLDLNGKSIDILGKTENRTFCFEYQGEQHYKPITVTYDEYAKFPIFTKMREHILTECGFIQKTVGGTKFFSGPETANAEKMYEIKKIILDTYKMFADSLVKTLDNKYHISRRINEDFNNLGKLNRGAKFENDSQILAYFQKILEESRISDVFEKAPMEDVVPYVGSPSRFLDEVKTAQDMGRDIKKRDIIGHRPGWILSYIIPGRATKDEEEYTAELAGSPKLVFQWNKEGKIKLLNFMQSSGILAHGVLDETLFQQIFKELFTD